MFHTNLRRISVIETIVSKELVENELPVLVIPRVTTHTQHITKSHAIAR